MKFSIVVVTLNAGEDLLTTIKSIGEQTYKDYEIIVKDGGSTDGSVEKIPENEKIKIVKEKDTGIYDAMNQGIGYATGDYLLFMNCGDTFYKDTVLEEVVGYIDTSLENCIYYGDCYTVNRNAFVRYPDVFDDYVCCTKTLCHQATIYKVDMLKSRGFDTKYKIAGDFHYYVSAYASGTKMVHLPVVIANYLGGGASESHKNRNQSMRDGSSILKEAIGEERYKKVQMKAFWRGRKIKTLIRKSKILYKPYSWFAGFVYRMKDKINGR